MKIGLSLAGGGVKGSYQIGSYLAFKKCHIKFNGIVGTSIGAANGAIMASGNEKKLLQTWKNMDTAKLLNFDDNIVNYAINKKLNLSIIKGAVKTSKRIIKNQGIDINNIKELLNSLININKIKNNNVDYGLVTYNFTKKEPVYIFKEDIPSSEFIDYIIASCSLPIFKLDKSINDELYIDGGFYDNCPSIMLVNKKYDLIYEIKINGIGRNRKINNLNSQIITISPSRSNGSILELNKDVIIDNIYMGYYDTLKTLNKFNGEIYTFTKDHFINYDNLLKKDDKFTLNRLKNFFNCYNAKKLIYKSVEYVMQKENYDYNKIYHLKKVVKELPLKKHFIYEFVKHLFN